MSWKHQRLLLAGTCLLAITACGGHSVGPVPRASEAQSDAATPPVDDASAEPSTSSPAPALSTSATALVGMPLLNDDSANQVCDAALNGGAPPDAPSPGASPSQDLAVTVGPTATASDDTVVEPGGLAVLRCSSDSNQITAVGFDLIRREIVWKQDVSLGYTYVIGTRHLFVINSSSTAASGLQAGTTSYTLAAFSLHDGSSSWSVPLRTDGTPPEQPDNLTVAEGLSGVAGHDMSAVVSGFGTSAYDDESGQNLWHTATDYMNLASGSYTGSGVVEGPDHDTQQLDGYDARTDKTLWKEPEECNGDRDVLLGNTEWIFGLGNAHCYYSHDVQTGRVLLAQTIPDSWTGVEADTQHLAAFHDAHVWFYRTSDLRHPLWSIPADEAEAIAVSRGHLLVTGPSGLLFLSARDGSIVSTVAETDVKVESSDFANVTDGLQQTGNTIFELDPPLSSY